MKKKLLLPALAPLAAACVLALLVYHGIVQRNYPDRSRYPVDGVDVSAWQGDIDWTVLAGEDIRFAFIKATEGATFVDRQFAVNWEGARGAGLYTGAYHFFSFDSTGGAQAENFIGTMPSVPGALPPVVDIEFYGDKAKNPPGREEVGPQLVTLLQALEAEYGQKPILYATMSAYRLYLQGEYGEYPVWIRSVWTKPRMPDDREWAFWQYTDRARLEGYTGRERFIDRNVYNGSLEDFQALFGLQEP